MSEATRDGWSYCHVDRIRFGDVDAMRHLNNVAALGFFEDARVQFLARLIGDDPTTRRGFGLIFAELRVNYRAPAFYDEEIRTCVRPAKVARSSVQLAFEMHAVSDERLVAEGYGVVVGYDYAAGRSKPLPESFKAALGAGAPA
ncbi:MAG: acyl-CoA thioesterase [Actinobacteria bacterium]|nr:acyl-CoA thioesterase [Actinomycetota bacterium]